MTTIRMLFIAGLVCCLSQLSAVDLNDLNIRVTEPIEGEGADGATAEEQVDPELLRNLAVVWDYDKGVAFYVDDMGNKMAGPFQDAYPFEEGLGLAQGNDNIYRLYDGKGKVGMEPPQWGFFRSVFSEGLVVVEGDDGEGNRGMHFFDRKGKMVLGNFQKAWPFTGGFAVVVKDGKPGIINRSGKVILNGQPVEKHFGDEVAAVRMNAGGAWYFVDTDGQRVCGSTWQEAGAFSQGWAPVLYDPQEGEWAFIDKYGDLMDKRDRFHEAKAFRDGVAPVKNKKGKWGLIDLGGKKVCSYKYDNLGEMYEGRAKFYDADTALWGFIDRSGKVVIKPRFGGAFDFTNGLALVSEGNSDFYINTQGNQVWPKKP